MTKDFKVYAIASYRFEVRAKNFAKNNFDSVAHEFDKEFYFTDEAKAVEAWECLNVPEYFAYADGRNVEVTAWSFEEYTFADCELEDLGIDSWGDLDKVDWDEVTRTACYEIDSRECSNFESIIAEYNQKQEERYV